MTLDFVSSNKIVNTGRIFFAAGLAGIGLQHFFFGQFIPVVVPLWPDWIPGRPFWVYCVGAVLLACAGAILSGIRARAAALLLGVLFLFSAVFLHIPAQLLKGASTLGSWTDPFKALAFAGGAFVIAGTLPKAGDGRGLSSVTGPLEKLIPLGMYPLAIMVIVFGIDHFLYPVFVASLVPGWIPWHLFWAYFAGAALIASGVGMTVRMTARLAATLLGVMIFLWVVMLHIPRAVADPYGAIGNEISSVFEALAFSGLAFILGQTLSKKEWFLSREKAVSTDDETYLDRKHSLGD